MPPDDLFTLHSAHRDSVARGEMPPFKRSQLHLHALISGVLLLCICLAALHSLDARRHDSAMEARALRVQARVMELRTTTSDGIIAYWITYSYAPLADPRTRYTRRAALPEDAWRATCKGCAIAIRYLPDQPEISALDGESLLQTSAAVNIFLALAAAIGIMLSATRRRALRRTQRLRRDGALRMGTLCALHHLRQESDEGERTTLQLVFQLDGDDATLSTHTDKRLPGPLRVGQRVAVAYLSPTEFELL